MRAEVEVHAWQPTANSGKGIRVEKVADQRLLQSLEQENSWIHRKRDGGGSRLAAARRETDDRRLSMTCWCLRQAWAYTEQVLSSRGDKTIKRCWTVCGSCWVGAQRGNPHLLEEVILYHWGEGVGADPWRLRSLTGKGELRFWKRRALWAEGTTCAANGLMLSGVTALFQMPKTVWLVLF